MTDTWHWGADGMFQISTSIILLDQMVRHLEDFNTYCKLALLDPAFSLCCNNCLRRRREDPDHILTNAESSVLVLMDCIQTQLKPGNFQDVIDVDLDTLVISAENPKHSGPRCTERLQSCHDAITEWRSRTWLENYSDCT
jgi:hypothetical protein